MKNDLRGNKNKVDTKAFALVIISALMVTIYITSNVMSVKFISILGVPIFDAGTITFPISFVLGDVLTEIWGYYTAKKVIFLTAVCNLMFILATSAGIFFPAPNYMNQINHSYETIFSVTPRILAASLTAFLIGELLNSWIMGKIKARTGNKHLWFRTISSSAVGYFFDTSIFVFIAFFGVCPVSSLLFIIFIQYITKIVIESAFGTPLTYVAVRYLKKIGLGETNG